jgi:RNA polymerase sigma-70 factor (ECF subfamily)
MIFASLQPGGGLARLSAVPQLRGVFDDRFDDFYLFSYRKLVAGLAFITGDQDLATEAVDEACARAAERLARGRDIEVLEAWIRVVSRNVARGRLRRLGAERRARRKLVAGWEETEPAVDTAGVLDLQAALNDLPRQQREAVVFHYFLGLSVDAIADELRLPSGTVKSALHRARAVLARQLADTPDQHTRERR